MRRNATRQMKSGLETLRKQAQHQLQIRLRPFIFTQHKLGKIQIGARRIEGRVPKFEQSLIDGFHKMSDVVGCVGVKHIIGAILDPLCIHRKLIIHCMNFVRP